MANLEDFFKKTYKLEESDNFENYMKSWGVNLVTRKFAKSVSPVFNLTKEGDEYVITQISSLKNMIIRFKPGIEFEQETPDGRSVKSVITVDGNKLHEVQKDESGNDNIIDRVFTDTEVKMTMKHGDVKATRIYKLQE